MENINALLDSLGLHNTRLRRKMMDVKAAAEGRENISTPQEMLTLLEKIYQEKVLNKEMTADFVKMLSTHKDSFIPRDLPDGLRIANKPGELEAVRNDSGIVFLQNRPYITLRHDHVSRPRTRRGRSHRQNLRSRVPLFRSAGAFLAVRSRHLGAQLRSSQVKHFPILCS